MQEARIECNGNFYNPLNETCVIKLAEVDKVIQLYDNTVLKENEPT